MKKVLSVIAITVLAVCIFAGCSTASDGGYYVSELGLSMDVPSELSVFMRDFDQNDIQLGRLGITADAVSSALYDYDGYLIALSADLNYEYGIMSFEKSGSYSNYATCTDEQLYEVAESWLSNEEINEYYALHKQGGATYIVSSNTNGGVRNYLDYYTIIDYTVYQFYVVAYDGSAVTTENERILVSMVNSVSYNASGAQTESGNLGLNIAIDAFATLVFVMVPVLLIRGSKKQAMTKPKALLTALSIGLIAAAILLILKLAAGYGFYGVTAILWMIVGFLILSAGGKPTAQEQGPGNYQAPYGGQAGYYGGQQPPAGSAQQNFPYGQATPYGQTPPPAPPYSGQQTPYGQPPQPISQNNAPPPAAPYGQTPAQPDLAPFVAPNAPVYINQPDVTVMPPQGFKDQAPQLPQDTPAPPAEDFWAQPAETATDGGWSEMPSVAEPAPQPVPPVSAAPDFANAAEPAPAAPAEPASFPPIQPSPTAPEQSPANEFQFCAYCGAKYAASGAFCPQCGQKSVNKA